mgnify:CR=1 FL=1
MLQRSAFCLFAYLTARNRAGAVAVETADVRTNINLNDIAFLDNCVLGRNTVDDLVIQRYAGAAREAAVARKDGLAPASSIVLRTMRSISQVVTPGFTASAAALRAIAVSGRQHAFFQALFRLDMNHITDPAPLLQTFR